MFRLLRSTVYAIPFIAFWFVLIPGQILAWPAATMASSIGAQLAGWLLVTAGAVLALSCILMFVFVGKGTQAPFDPPRRLVVRGPYTIVRNPMYLGGGLLLAGASILYASPALFAYALFFLGITHLFVIGYEEPTLHRMFDGDYDTYCARVGRWLPTFSWATD